MNLNLLNIGIVGCGVVGTSIAKLFRGEAVGFDVVEREDENYKKGIVVPVDILPTFSGVLDYLFICVPTPLKEDPWEGLSMDIVWKVCSLINEMKTKPIVIVSTTLQPGTADEIVKKYGFRLVVQPEYLGETPNHPLTDLSKTPFMVLGGDTEDVNHVIELYQYVYNANVRIRKVTRKEAEVIKLSENRAIAFKVLQCQELYDACRKCGVDYNIIREAVYGDDPRFNLYWTFVYPSNRGMNSKCLPKDLYAWYGWYNGGLTETLLEYNELLLS
jgi:UDP-glucose 6-dehydrogenase